jgi:hypothetical protein
VRTEDHSYSPAPPEPLRSFVPSPLVGEGMGGGCHATGRFDLRDRDSHLLLLRQRLNRTPFLGLPLSPTLPHKGGGSTLRSRSDRDVPNTRAQRCSA